MSALRRWVLPPLRLGVFVGCCAALLGWLDYRAARASVVERLLHFGRRMAPYLDDARGTEAPRRVRLNGIELMVASGHTRHPASWVRAFYEERYAGRHQGLDALRDEPAFAKALPPELDSLQRLRFGDDRQGGMVAIDWGGGPGLGGLRERLAQLRDSGDLGALGALRYLYVEQEGQGARFLTVWSEGPLALSSLLPRERQDAEGQDVAGVPRYPGTVRLLSAEEVGLPQRIAVYQGAGSPDAAAHFYAARMRSLGWTGDERFASLSAERGQIAQRWESPDGHEAVIALSPDGDEGGLLVSIVRNR